MVLTQSFVMLQLLARMLGSQKNLVQRKVVQLQIESMKAKSKAALEIKPKLSGYLQANHGESKEWNKEFMSLSHDVLALW